jgi:hypothetical protein
MAKRKYLAWDVTVSNTLAESYISSAFPGSVAEIAAERYGLHLA